MHVACRIWGALILSLGPYRARLVPAPGFGLAFAEQTVDGKTLDLVGTVTVLSNFQRPRCRSSARGAASQEKLRPLLRAVRCFYEP